MAIAETWLNLEELTKSSVESLSNLNFIVGLCFLFLCSITQYLKRLWTLSPCKVLLLYIKGYFHNKYQLPDTTMLLQCRVLTLEQGEVFILAYNVRVTLGATVTWKGMTWEFLFSWWRKVKNKKNEFCVSL